MAASAIDPDVVSMDFERPDDDDDDALSFDDENFNPNNQKSKKSTGGGKKAVVVAAVAAKAGKATAKPASQKTIEQTYQKKTQLEVRRPLRMYNCTDIVISIIISLVDRFARTLLPAMLTLPLTSSQL